MPPNASTPDLSQRHVVVVGGGITGLAAAHALLHPSVGVAPRVTVLEAAPALGGLIRTTPFAGLPAVDEGADAFLARVPHAVDLARNVGLGDHLVSPSAGRAAVWWDGLHDIPEGLLLGMPTDLGALARTRLISWRGKARAATEPLRPRSSTKHDSLGRYVRQRFGDEVHERLVDPLVGSIYAADTDRFSLAAVTQIADVASRERSILLAARHRPPAPTGPIFLTPQGGMGDVIGATAAAVASAGGTIVHRGASALERRGGGWEIDGMPADAVLIACPARPASDLLRGIAPLATPALRSIEAADIILVTLAVPTAALPHRVRELSGYLVPKPKQRAVTAISFGSHKWAHWASSDTAILRVSLGRDGSPVAHLDDDDVVALVVDDLAMHLGITVSPSAVRISRWTRAFPHYRPHHAALVAHVEALLPDRIALAGASYHGIGIPACIRSAQVAAGALTLRLSELAN